MKQIHDADNSGLSMVEVVLLGNAQDGGRPQPGCNKPCCIGLSPNDYRYPTSLGIIDQEQLHIIDASRHLGSQLQLLENRIPDEIWITHAHFGHIDGLGLFGRETINAKGIILHVSKRMEGIIRETPHWRLMLEQGVFSISEISDKATISNAGFTITPILVPHRGELSDMHAFVIRGQHKSLLYLPDHDTWKETLKLHEVTTIRQWLKDLEVDIALLDGTFWSHNELQSRSQNIVPHPPIKETINLLGYKQQGDPDILFFHLNHTNPVFDEWSEEHTTVVEMGWKIAKQGQRFIL